MKNKVYRLVFVALWFVVLPLGLTALTVSSLSDPYAAMGHGPLSLLRQFATEQKLPALIVFFVIFETAIYSLRYSLPYSAEVGVAGRPGLPKASRKDYEAAGQLLDEVGRILSKNESAIKKELSEEKREGIDAAMQRLADAMDAPEFSRTEFEQALDAASELAAKHLAQWQRGETREYVESIIIAVGVALLLRAFVVEAFKIPSGSMLPTLQINDHIFVNKLSYGPKIPFTETRLLADLPPERGDILVFEYPDDNPNNPRQDFIKRAIAVPGDILETDAGHPIINGWKVPYCTVGNYSFDESSGFTVTGELFVEFLGDYSYLTYYENNGTSAHREGPYHVKEGEFWVMGDNRNSSLDSRRWRNNKGAGVPYDNVKGKAMFVWLSFHNDLSNITWDRLFTNVMGHPRLPQEADPALKTKIEECLAQRPSNTTPPPPEQAELQAKN